MAAAAAAAAAAPGAQRLEQVVELFQNQRYRKFKGWSSRYLLKSDPGRYSDHTGGGWRERLDSRPPAGCVWGEGDTGWELDKSYTRCDDEGWTYASSFRDFTSSNPGLPAAAEHGTRVRRRRYIRRGVVVEDDYNGETDDDVGSSVSSSSRPGSRRLTGKGGSVGSRGSRRLTGRGSVGFALAPLDEVESMRVEVVIHGESFIVTAGPNDSVRWLQQEASALFSKEHNFRTHVVQVVETYPRDIFQANADALGGGDEGGDASLHPLNPESLVRKAISTKDRTLFHPAPMEDGVSEVADAKIWARVQATVTVPPGPLGVVLDGEVGDRPVVLEIPGQSGPAQVFQTVDGSRDNPAGSTMPEGFATTPTGTNPAATTTPFKVKPKVTRKDRAKRLLLNLATKHHFHTNATATATSNTSPVEISSSAAAAAAGRSPGSKASSPGGGGGHEALPSPLVTATDAATVRPGMVLAAVAARGGQGVSEEAVDTLGMGVKEAIETLVRYQHLHRAITFIDPPSGWSSEKDLDMAGGAVGAGVTCPYSVGVTVVEARGLKRSDIFTADPFAWLRLGGSSHKTSVCRSTSRPHWGETFKFALLSLERSLVVQVWDADELGADVLLGETSVNLSKLPVNNPFQLPDAAGGAVADVWYNLQVEGGGNEAGSSVGSRGVRLKISIDQQLHVAIHKKKVDSAARLLQGAMRSFVFRRQTLTNRQKQGRDGTGGAPPLPPRSRTATDTTSEASSSAPAADAALAAFAVADSEDAAGRGVRGGGGMGYGGGRQQSSRKSVAGAVGGGWEASGAHAASTLADVFPDEVEDTGGGGGGGGASFGSSGGGDPATRGVSAIVTKFLEGPALERFASGGVGGVGGGGGGCGGGGGGGILRKSSVGTLGGRRSTLASGRRSSAASVRFVDGGRRSTVGGWGEGDEAARPGASVCKDCLSDVGSLLAVAMAPAEAARTTMEDATHLRYPTVLPDSTAVTPLAVTAFPAPRGGFGPLTVASCTAFDPLRRSDWADHAAPVLVAPSAERAAEVESAAGEVWSTIVREAAAASGGAGARGGVGGMVGIGGGAAGGSAAAAALASKASVTVVLKDGGCIRIIPGEEFQYWRWASALSLAVSGSSSSSHDGGEDGEGGDADSRLTTVMKEVRTHQGGGGGGGGASPSPEKNADAVCSLHPADGWMSWARTLSGPRYEIPLSSVKGLVLSQSHGESCKFLFTVTVVSGCLAGIADGASSWAGGKLQSYCRVEAGGEKSRTKVATGGTPFWNHRCTFAVSEAEAMSPGGGARICCLSHRVAYQDSQIGESFIPFASLTSGKDYTETLDISGNLRRLRLVLHSARGLVSSDVTGVSDPYCIVVPVRHDGSEVTSEKGETTWRRGGARQRPEEWQEAFELCRWCTPEDVKGVKVSLLDRDMGGKKDEALGEVFIPIASFKEPKAKRTKLEMKITPPPPATSRYSKTLGKYNINIKTPSINIKTPNILGGGGRSPSASPPRGRSPPASPVREPPDLGTLCVSMSVIETELPDTSTYRGRGVPPGGVKIRCSLDLADEFTCAWPALLLRHGAPSSGSGGDADEEGGGRGGGVEKWRVSAGFGGLVLSKVASGEGAAADSSPFLRMDPSGPADGYVMEVYENQRKKQPWGWGSGRKRHLRTSDPGRFSDAKGENRLHVKLLEQAEVPAGWAWSAPAWTIVGGDCPRDKDGWTYGTDGSFSSLLADRTSGVSKEQKGTAVRCRRWVRPLQRTGVVASTPALPPRTGAAGVTAGAAEGEEVAATVEIPDGLKPFCRPELDGRVVALVHENQRYQPGAGWGSTDEDHLLPEDRAPLTGASGIHAIDDLDDLDPSSLGGPPPGYRWEDEDPNHDDAFADGWNSGPWTYAESFGSLPPELKLTAAAGPPPLPLGRGRAGAGAGDGPGVPVSPPPPPPDRPAGVRSRAWWRCMVVADDGSGGFGTSGSRVVSMGRRRSSVAVGRRKVPHAATTSTTTASSRNGGGGNGSGDRIRVPLERLKRAVVAGPNTLIVDLEVEEEAAAGGRAWRPATLVVGPCDAPRLGSLLVERALTAIPRRSLGQVVRSARKLASKPPPLPPRPSARGLGSNGGGGGSGADVVRGTTAAAAPPKAEGSWQSDPGKLAAKEGTGGSNNNPFGPKTPPAAGPHTNLFGSGGAAASSSPPPLPRRSGSPFQSREEATTTVVVAASSASPRKGGGGPPVFFPSSSGPSPPAAGPLEAVLGDAVGLLQQAGRAVASLDDAYNAAYNASAAADGWGGQGHDVAELGEAVLWTLWSRLVRLHAYLRQLLAETPAQKLQICAAVKRKDWGVLVGCMDAEAAHQRSAVLSEIEAEAEADEGEDSPARPSGPGRALQGSMKVVKGLCGALDRMVTEMLLCADTVPESVLRRAVEVLASQCYIKVVDEVGRHITFRYEGVLPLADQELLALLDVLVNKADLIERTLQPRLDLVGWRSSPPPLLTKAVSVPWLLRAYATSIEGKLSGLFRNILDTNKETHEFPPEPSATSDQAGEGNPQPKSPTSNALMRMKLAGRGVGVGGTKSKQRRQQQQQQLGFSMWTLHESTAKPLSVVPTTAIALLDTYVVTVAKRFPDDAGVQAVILRAGAGALGSLRNVISAHAEAAVSQCPEKGWDKLLRFLCATANDCWHLVSEALPAIEERHPQAMSEGAEESYETLKELWVLLGVSCCRKAARLVLGFMEADGLFALEGIHVAGAEESMVEIREALEYYCINFLRPWLEEYFYQKVLVRLCDHIVVWAAQGLVRAAAAGRPPLHSGQMLRLAACRETLAEALKTCSVRKGGDAGDGGGEGGAGGGMYERRLAFLDDLLELLRVPSDQLEGVFTGMLGRHIHCQRSVQHALQVVLCLRADGSTVPGGVSKWADEDNWMGGDAIVLTADTAEIEPFHRVFRRPLSLLRADPTPLVAPTVLNRASDGGRRQSAAPLPAAKDATHDNTTGNPSAGGGGGGGGWAKRGLTFAGSGGLGIALGGGDGGGATSGVKKGMAKLKKGLRKASTRGGGKGGGGGAAAVAMSGVGVDDSGPQTILRVTILEAEGLRNVAVLKKTDSYVAAELVTRTGRREGRTAVQKNTCDPKWNEPLSFLLPSGSVIDAQLSLRIVGKQKLRDDLPLGRVELPLAGISTAGTKGPGDIGAWFQLLDGQGRLKIDAEVVTRRPSLIV